MTLEIAKIIFTIAAAVAILLIAVTAVLMTLYILRNND